MELDHLSWSKENRFANCGQSFAYVYGEGLKRPPGVAQVRGLAPHRSSEADLKAKLERGTLLERENVAQIATDYIDEAFRGEVSIDGEFEGLSPKEAKNVAREDARKMAFWHHDNVAPAIVPTGLELRVRANFPELPIPYEGVIDVIDGEEDVRDLKTKRKSPNGDMAETSGQLTIYHGLFYALKLRPPARLAFDVLWVTPGGKTSGKALYTIRDDQDLAVHFLRTHAMLAAVEKEIFLPAPVDAWICNPRWCGFTDICPYYAGRNRPTS